MSPEYLYNNDTRELQDRVRALAASNEPALYAECEEVSRLVDTSSLDAKEEIASKIHTVGAIFTQVRADLQALSCSLSAHADVFRMRDGQVDFGAVCHAVTQIEEGRLKLLSGIADLTRARQALFAFVAEANRSLHFLRIARGSVPKELHSRYAKPIERTEAAYRDLKELDGNIGEVQNFSMTFVERHLPAFMARLHTAADFNHRGEALDRGAIQTLCNEVLIVINRVPNITF